MILAEIVLESGTAIINELLTDSENSVSYLQGQERIQFILSTCI